VPTYQYACTTPECGHEFEAVQSFSDTALTSCPVCEGRLRKIFSAVGVVFKGPGFYRTDSRKPENGSGGEKGEKTERKDAAPAGGAASDSKQAGGSGSKSDNSSSGASSAPTPKPAAAASSS